MKMRPGPKAVLTLIMVGVFVGFGFWAGRGFPRTWEGAFHTRSAVPVNPSLDTARFESLEARVSALEQEVTTLKDDARAARQAAPTADEARPSSDEPSNDGPTLPQPTPNRQDTSADAGVEYR